MSAADPNSGNLNLAKLLPSDSETLTDSKAASPDAGPVLSQHGAPKIPDHELLMPLGKGSYGEVWLAQNVMGTYRAVIIAAGMGPAAGYQRGGGAVTG